MSHPNDDTAVTVDSSSKSLFAIGGMAALLALALAPAEVIIGLLPGVQDRLAHTVTVVDWFTLFQNHPFLALRNLGLLNMIGAVLLIPAALAIYFALQRVGETYTLLLGTVLFFVGVSVYLACNRAFPMLLLSHQYAVAATVAQRSILIAAGQALLIEAQSRTGILLIEFAFLVISAAMLNSRIFSKATAWAGILGNLLMMILEIAFMPPHGIGLAVAAAAGLSIMTWYFLTGRRLLQLVRLSTGDRNSLVLLQQNARQTT
jgi:hypothetical protein